MSATDETEGSTGLAKLAHLSSLGNALLPPLGTIVPIALWVMKSGEDELAVDSAKEALNFQISTILWALGILLATFVIPPLAYLASFFFVVLLVAYVVMPIVATVRISDGVPYRYPYTLHLL